MAHTERLARLLENLVEHFDLDEFRTLCFDLGVDSDDPLPRRMGRAEPRPDEPGHSARPAL